jgi:hypothetical protein
MLSWSGNTSGVFSIVSFSVDSIWSDHISSKFQGKSERINIRFTFRLLSTKNYTWLSRAYKIQNSNTMAREDYHLEL